MEIFKTLASHSDGVTLLAAMVLLANLNLVNALEEDTATVSYFKMIKTGNKVSHTIVNRTYENTGSILHCGMRCSNILAPSFYYVDQTSTCHCNNHYDLDVEEDNGPGSITYGLMVASPREGNSSECQILLFYQGVRDGGLYIDSTGDPVFCNPTAIGWIVFQRRLDGSVDFNRTWTDYVNGFGDPHGEFWLGLETMHQLTKDGCELNIYLEAEPNMTVQDTGYARYSNFSVSNATDNYRLYVSGFSGNVGDSLIPNHDGYMFSTYDVDNDVSSFGSGNCAQDCGGAWWFSDCYWANLNGDYLGRSDGPCITGVIWDDPWGYYDTLTRTEMTLRC